MLNLLIIIIASLLFVIPVIGFNNKEIIFREKKNAQRVAALFTPRKNTIVAIGLGVFVGSALAFWLMWYYNTTLLHTVKMLFVYIWLITVAYIDGKKKIIPNKWIAYGLISWCVFYLLECILTQATWKQLLFFSLGGVLFGGGLFLLVALISKGSMGMGDVKLYTVLGLMLGWQNVFNIILFALVSLILYWVVMVVMEKIEKKAMIPIGPFTYIAMLLGILLGI